MSTEPEVSSVPLCLNEWSDSYVQEAIMRRFVHYIPQGVGSHHVTGASSSRNSGHGFTCWPDWCVVIGAPRCSLMWGCVMLHYDWVPATGADGRAAHDQWYLQLHTDAIAAGNKWGHPWHRYESAAVDPGSSPGDQDYHANGDA